MKIGLAQINSIVGDFEGNADKILQAYHELVANGAEVVLTPEMALTGYPPQDLLFQSGFVDGNLTALAKLGQQIERIPLLVGYVDYNSGTGRRFRNSAALLSQNTTQKCRVCLLGRCFPRH